MDIVFLDLAKTFDKVPRKRLVEKVAKHGIGGRLYKVTENWLSGRKQRVCIKGCESSWQAVLSGVPQCSVLGPVLLLIFINNLDEIIRNFILKFADDTKVFGKTIDDNDKCKLQEDLNKFVSWAQKWKMEFNVRTCKVMHTGNTNNKFSYEMNGKVLDKVLVETDLGIMSDVKSSQQCVVACNKPNEVLGIIRRTISYKEQ